MGKCIGTIVALVAACAGTTGWAATPGSGTVSSSNTQQSWQGAMRLPTAAACTGPTDPACDHFLLTIVPPAHPFEVKLSLTMAAVDDWDLAVYGPDGQAINTSGNAAGATEVVTLPNPAAGTYTVSAAPYAVLGSYTGKAELRAIAAPPTVPPGSEPLRFRTYAPPGLAEPDPGYLKFAPARGDANIGLSAGEPTLGVPMVRNRVLQQTSPNLSRIMYIAGLETLRLEVNSCTSPAVGSWANKSSPTHLNTLDPILHVQPETGRTISTQLAGKRSLISLSDNDGDSWLDSPQGAGINSGVDHQTVGGGAYSPTDPLGTQSIGGYPNFATYYSSQDIAVAQTAQSRDGGLTWGVAVPMYNLTQCGGLHGHVQVSPSNGTVFVPNGNCPLGQSGFARSTDGGTTWTQVGVPGTSTGDDPGMAVGSDGTVYFGTCNNNATPVVAVSGNNGNTWSSLRDVGSHLNIRNCTLPTLVAGDGDRAAFAFLGSSEPGAAGVGADPTAFDGTWYLYVAVTYDRGATWTTVNVTPDDPVQRGPICLQGTLCESNRNLLDFNDIQLDEKGRVYVGYADGCVGGCVTGGPNSGTAHARIARQEPGSRGLYAAFDGVLKPSVPRAPDAPYLEAFAYPDRNLDDQPFVRVELKWTRPFDGNSALTGYRVFRRPVNGSYGPTPLASIANPDTLGYVDTPLASGDFCYRVLADNAAGASAACHESCAATPVLDNFCSVPYAERASDAQGDGVAQLDIRRLALGEPFLGDPLACAVPAPQRLLFQLKLDSAAATTAGNAWIILWNRQFPVPDETGLQTYDRQMLSVRSNGTGVACSLGKVTAPSVNQGNDQVPIPAANCQLRPDGELTVIVPLELVDDCQGPNCRIGAGYELAGLEVRSFAANASGQPVLRSAAADYATALTYRLVGNESCRPDERPTAVDDNYAANLARPQLSLDLLVNDRANDCDSLSISTVGAASFGTVAIGSGGQVIYTPANPANPRADQFAYSISDGGKVDQGVVKLCHHPQAGIPTNNLVFTAGFEDGLICPQD